MLNKTFLVNSNITSPASGIFTPAEGISIVTSEYAQNKIGKTVSLWFSVHKTDETTFSAQRVTLGTLAAGWRPLSQISTLAAGSAKVNFYTTKVCGMIILRSGEILADLFDDSTKEIQINCNYFYA